MKKKLAVFILILLFQKTLTAQGLTASYFNNITMEGRPVLTRTDQAVNFNWDIGSPGPGVNADNFSVVWTGQIYGPRSGNYSITTVSDDGIRLWVDNRLIIDNWTIHPPTSNTGIIYLQAGRRYDLRLEYYEAQGGASLTMSWLYQGQTSQIIPSDKFFPTGSSTRKMTRFDPTFHGFKFANNFLVPTTIAGLNGPTFAGLCGGMTYTALDYFKAAKRIPEQNFMPAQGTPLATYIQNRQNKSLTSNIDKWAELLVNPFGERNRTFFNWGIEFGGGRLGELMAKINRGEPVPLGLWECGGDCNCPGGCPKSHQVLAIGYELGRYKGNVNQYAEDVSIFIYDPNFPGRTMTLKPNVAGAMYGYKEEDWCRWRAYFTDYKYSPANPVQVSTSVNEVVATFITGGDDLRGGNDNVHLVLLLKSGENVRFNNVNNQRKWVDGATQTITRPLAASFRAEDVAGIRIETTFGGGFNGDNWNMEALTIKIKTGSSSTEIFNRSGTPLMRFTGDKKVYEVRFP